MVSSFEGESSDRGWLSVSVGEDGRSGRTTYFLAARGAALPDDVAVAEAVVEAGRDDALLGVAAVFSSTPIEAERRTRGLRSRSGRPPALGLSSILRMFEIAATVLKF